MSRTQSSVPHRCLAASEAAVLRSILTDDPRCRRVWQRHLKRQPSEPGVVCQAAVARALALWLVDAGEASERDELLARRLKDCISRALTGRVRLSALLKEAVIDVFDVDEPTAELLWDPPVCQCSRAA